MKKIFIAIVALAAAAACSNNEVVSLNQEAIAFDNAFVNNSTRSVVDPSLTTETLKDHGFSVYGTVTGAETSRLFDNKTVTWDNDLNKYTYSGTQYWINGAFYKFAAVAPASKTASGATYADAENAVTIEGYTNDGTTDLLYSFGTALVANNAVNYSTPVAFDFHHALSKVKFSFENAYNADNTTIKVHSIAITNAYTTGKVVLAPDAVPAWSEQASASLSLNFGVATDKEGTDDKENEENDFAYNVTRESQKELLLIPGNQTLSVTFKYDILVGGKKINTFTVTPSVAVNLLPGNAYDFKATIVPGKPIEFTVTSIDGWATPEQNPSLN